MADGLRSSCAKHRIFCHPPLTLYGRVAPSDSSIGPIGIWGTESRFTEYRPSRWVSQVVDRALQCCDLITQVAEYVSVAWLAQQTSYFAGLVVVVYR